VSEDVGCQGVSESEALFLQKDTGMAESGRAVEKLLGIMCKLRGSDGCPWDREQTLNSLKAGLIEETYEVIDAIESGDVAALREELGDLLLQVVFQSQICSEKGDFEFKDVVEDLCDKLIRRHPHVFGEAKVINSCEVVQNPATFAGAAESLSGSETRRPCGL